MSDPVETTTSSTVQFGVGYNATYGIVQKVDIDETAEVAEARNELGKVVARKAYSKTKTINMEALFQTGVTLPGVGETATYESETYLVTSVKTTRSNTEFTTLSFTLEKKDASTDAAYS